MFFLTSFYTSYGQEAVACRWIPSELASAGFVVDSLTVIEESIQVTDCDQQVYGFSFNINSNALQVEVKPELVDSIRVCYSTYPFSLHQVHAKRTLLADYDSMALFKERTSASETFNFKEELFPSTNLHKSGSLTRGISFGNTQNVFVNSSLNLQMEGLLTEDLHIRASITDQNVPFQPEGNTQQLQDFDNVLVELYNDQLSLSAGDVVLQQRHGDFLRYRKNVQGLLFTTSNDFRGGWKGSTQVGVSIAKGKFASTQLEVLEGVSGPYRIPGPQNERFVIVMANSEKVFLDGRELQRGYNYDYIIDYNQGEITFTPHVVITAYSRVRIDFEYAQRNFSRSILTANHIQENERVSLFINYYKEQDNKNRPLFIELAEQDKRLLSLVGDSLDAAVVPRVDSMTYDVNRILYRKVKYVDQEGVEQVVFEYSTDPEQAFYAVSFNRDVNGGDYRRTQQLANGVVYEYIPRVNGIPQGEYAVYSTLPAPNKKQMITAGARVRLNDHEEAYSEVAFSDTDLNLFSEVDSEDDKGFALKAGIQSNREASWLKDYSINSLAEVEYNSTDFNFIDRYRAIEFDRDWALSPEDLLTHADEKLLTAKVEAIKNTDNQFLYRLHFRNRGKLLSGLQQSVKINKNVGSRWVTTHELFTLQSNLRNLQSRWIRYSSSLQYRSKIFFPGYQFNIDRNRTLLTGTDSVVSSLMDYKEHRIFLTTHDSLPYTITGDASWREDSYPIEGKLQPYTKAFTTNYGLQRKFNQHDVKATFIYRKLTHLSRELPEETTIMGRLEYGSSLFDNNLRSDLNYAIGNGRELRREFVYLPVPTGEGTHTWRDDNGDGVQQLNEFYLAVNPEERNFVKMFVPTDEYLLAYTTLFNYRLNAKFPEAWRDKKGLKVFLQKFSNNTSWNVEKKVTASDLLERISPFTQGLSNEELISARQTFRSTLFFNRGTPKYGFDLSYFSSQSKQLLSGGFEDLVQNDWKLNLRYALDHSLNLMIGLNEGKRLAASDYLDNRNYLIDLHGINPELIWQPNTFFRSTGTYGYMLRKNLGNTEINEKALHHQFGLNLRYGKAIKTTINAHLNYTNIRYNGVVNSPTGYEMLQALTVGDNFIWRFNWLQKMGDGLQLNMIYEGRHSEGLDRLVHTGRMQLSALF
ncbi:MAG TPA: hypothetical protein VK014_11195 [Cyclobacteriaceae bacterium]|nr:hypothetical protein [Cyclobacteriaceae bacterium]